jgi:hypothetical protein
MVTIEYDDLSLAFDFVSLETCKVWSFRVLCG